MATNLETSTKSVIITHINSNYSKNKLLHDKILSISSESSKWVNNTILKDSTIKDIRAQYVELSSKNPDFKQKFIDAEICYRMLFDYVDMIHDFKKCDEIKASVDLFLKKIKSAELKRIINTKFDKLFRGICSGNGNIKVDESYVLQLQLIDEYINELRTLGFTIPSLPNPIVIPKDEKLLSDYFKGKQQNYYRESGSGLNKITGLNLVTKNAIGSIDGCAGQCDIQSYSQEVSWNQFILGFLNVNIRTLVGTNKNTVITVSSITDMLDGENIVFEAILRKGGRIKLNKIVEMLPDVFLKAFRGKITDDDEDDTGGDDDILQIKMMDNGREIKIDKNMPIEQLRKYFVFIIALKTVCDKTIIQRVQSDYNGTSKKIDILCTIDSYVPAISILEVLSTKIPYCIDSFLFKRDLRAFQILSYPTVDNSLLYNKFCYFASWINYLNKTSQSPVNLFDIYNSLRGIDQYVTTTYEQMDSYISDTDSIFEKVNQKLATFGSVNYSNLWDYLQTLAISSLKDKWEKKKSVFFEDLKSRAKQIFAMSGDVINSILSISESLDMTSEINEILAQCDIFGIPITSVDTKKSINQLNIFDFMAIVPRATDEKYIIEIKIENNQFLILKVKTDDVSAKRVQEIIGLINKDVEDSSEKVTSFVVNAVLSSGYDDHISIPLTAELLINLLIFIKKKNVDQQILSKLIRHKIGGTLYNLLKQWLPDILKDRTSFIKFIHEIFLGNKAEGLYIFLNREISQFNRPIPTVKPTQVKFKSTKSRTALPKKIIVSRKTSATRRRTGTRVPKTSASRKRSNSKLPKKSASKAPPPSTSIKPAVKTGTKRKLSASRNKTLSTRNTTKSRSRTATKKARQ